MDKPFKKIIFLGFLIIYIILFIIMLGLIYPFVRYVLKTEPMVISIQMNVIIAVSILMTGASLPMVNSLGVRKTWLIYMPFLLISLGLILFMNTYIIFLISGITLGIGSAGTLYIISFMIIHSEEGNKTRMNSCVSALILSLIILFICFALRSFGFGIGIFTVPLRAQTLSVSEVLRLRALMIIFPTTALLIGIIAALIEKGIGK
jgi:Na+/melibiose symporter-like transporter